MTKIIMYRVDFLHNSVRCLYTDVLTNEELELLKNHIQDSINYKKGMEPVAKSVVTATGGRANTRAGTTGAGVSTTSQPALRELIIEGLSQGRIQIPPGSIDRITNQTELKEVIRSKVAEFLASLPSRIVFDNFAKT